MSVRTEFSGFELREAGPGDDMLIWRLRNDPDTRSEFQGGEIPPEDHCLWYRESLALGENVYFIANRGETTLGYVRFDMAGGKVPDISFVVDPKYRGRCLGGTMMPMACRKFLEVRPAVARVLTRCAKSNPASYRVFRRCGFEEGEDADHYYYSATRNALLR